MEIWNQTAWYVELLYNVLLFILPTLAGVAVAGPLGLGAVRFVKEIWKELRPALDGPDDVIIRLIAARVNQKPEDVSKFIIDNVDSIIEALPEEATPRGA